MRALPGLDVIRITRVLTCAALLVVACRGDEVSLPGAGIESPTDPAGEPGSSGAPGASSSSGSDTNEPSLPSSDAGPDGAPCTSGMRGCFANVPHLCSQGTWLPQSACSGATSVCQRGRCVACEDGRVGCQNKAPIFCENGAWATQPECAGATPDCSAGACVACKLGPVSCVNDQTMRTCTARGYESLAACTDDKTHTCSGASCGACAAGKANCNGSASDGCESTYEAPCEPCGPKKITCYRDADGDSFGTAGTTSAACGTCGAGWTTNNKDCNDAQGAMNPDADWVYAKVDGSWDVDCDGQTTRALIDQGSKTEWPIVPGPVSCMVATQAACEALPYTTTAASAACGATGRLVVCAWAAGDYCVSVEVNTDRTYRVGCR